MGTRTRAARWALVLVAVVATAAGIAPRATVSVPRRLEHAVAAAPHAAWAVGHTGRHVLATLRLHPPATAAATPAGIAATGATLILVGASLRRRRVVRARAVGSAASRAPPVRGRVPAF